MTDRELIEGCLEGNLKHQRELYRHYAGKMMGICMRYAASEFEAEDILQEGFIIVFNKIATYSGKGELGAWIRKVIVNAALMHYRKNKKHRLQVEIDEVEFFLESGSDPFAELTAKDLMYMVQQLPAGYRMVFNLYAVEGYNHREIGEQLGISAGTSKSQYSRARVQLKQMIENEAQKVRGQAI